MWGGGQREGGKGLIHRISRFAADFHLKRSISESKRWEGGVKVYII